MLWLFFGMAARLQVDMAGRRSFAEAAEEFRTAVRNEQLPGFQEADVPLREVPEA